MNLKQIKIWTLILVLFATPLLASGPESHAMAMDSNSSVVDGKQGSMMMDQMSHHKNKDIDCGQACQLLNQTCEMGHNCHISFSTLIENFPELSTNNHQLLFTIFFEHGRQHLPDHILRPPKY